MPSASSAGPTSSCQATYCSVDQVQHAAADAGQQFARGQAVRPRCGRAEHVVVLEHGHAHLEEFVEVVGDDAQVAQTFQQGYASVSRLRQYAEIEFERGQFAAEVKLGSGTIRDRRGSGGFAAHCAILAQAAT